MFRRLVKSNLPVYRILETMCHGEKSYFTHSLRERIQSLGYRFLKKQTIGWVVLSSREAQLFCDSAFCQAVKPADQKRPKYQELGMSTEWRKPLIHAAAEQSERSMSRKARLETDGSSDKSKSTHQEETLLEFPDWTKHLETHIKRALKVQSSLSPTYLKQQRR